MLKVCKERSSPVDLWFSDYNEGLLWVEWYAEVDLLRGEDRRLADDIEEDAWRGRLLGGSDPGECISVFVLAHVDPLDIEAGETASELVDCPAIGDHVGIGGVAGSHDLAGHDVRVPEASESADGHLLGRPHPMEECFVLGHIVGARLEVDLQRVLELVAFWRCEDDASTRTLMALGPIEVESPELLVLLCFRKLCLFPVDEEICECLRLDCLPWLVVYVVDADFDHPLCHSTCCIAIADDVAEWRRIHYCH